MTVRQPRDIAEAARRVTAAMFRINAGIESLARESGWLLAMADNAAQVETLSSIRADTGYQLVKAIADAYDDLARYFSEEFKGE